MDVAFTDAQALGLVVLTAVLAVVAIACPFRWTLVAVAVGAAGYAASVRTLSGVLAALFVGLLASLVGTIVKARRDAGAEALAAQVQADMQAELARDLHDVLAHSLSGLALQLEKARLVAARDGHAELAADLAVAHGLARRGIDEARVAVASLRGDPGEQLGLAQLVAEHGSLAGVVASFSESGDPSQASTRARLAVYRVVQEALTNARRHGDAGTPVGVAVAWGPPVRVEVRSALVSGAAALAQADDEGQGEPRGRRSSGGFGLDGLRERVALMGGTLRAGPEAGPPASWVVVAVIP